MRYIFRVSCAWLVIFTLAAVATSGNLEEGMKAAKSGDYIKAHKLWTIEAEKGNAIAQYNLGLLYIRGLYTTQRGLLQDLKEAEKWFRKAAEQGYAPAQFNLGYMYASGMGLETDFKEAERWIRSSAMKDFAEAQFMLGGLYYEGKGVQKSKAEAYAWWSIAAGKAHSKAYQAIKRAEKEWDPSVIKEGKWRSVVITNEIMDKMLKELKKKN